MFYSLFLVFSKDGFLLSLSCFWTSSLLSAISIHTSCRMDLTMLVTLPKAFCATPSPGGTEFQTLTYQRSSTDIEEGACIIDLIIVQEGHVNFIKCARIFLKAKSFPGIQKNICRLNLLQCGDENPPQKKDFD